MNKISYIVLGFILIFFIGLMISPTLFNTSLNPQVIKENIEDYGLWAPIVLMIIIVTLCLISVLPTAPFIITFGYIFGTFRGTIYTLISVIFGVSFVFALARLLGRPFVEKIIEKKNLIKADIFVKKWGVWALLIQRFMPMFPENIISLSFGFTKMKYRTFIGLSLISIVPGAILQTYVGAKISDMGQLKTIFIVVVAVFILIFLLGLLFRKRIKKWVMKELDVVEKDIEKIKGLEKKEIQKLKKLEKKEIQKLKELERTK